MPAAMRFRTPATAFRARMKVWALRRQGADVLPLRLSARRVYILPTSAGWTFALLLAVMFVAGMNYGNGLALLFTFWLTGFALVAMVQTQRGLTGITVHAASAGPAHAGDMVRLRVLVSGGSAPADLHLVEERESVSAAGAATAAAAAGNDISQDQGGESSKAELLLELPAPRRGHWRAPALRLCSTAPFGLFRAWTWLTLDAGTLVYPAIAGSLPVPESRGVESGSLRHVHGLDELAWLRDFREGDSPRQVAWKAYARGQPLLVREYSGEGSRRHEFDFDALHGLDTEARLCQLTRWVVDASAQGSAWVLRLPGAPPMAGNGP